MTRLMNRHAQEVRSRTVWWDTAGGKIKNSLMGYSRR